MMPLARPKYERLLISIRADQRAAVRQLAAEDGHGNVSRIVQELIEEEVTRRTNERNEKGRVARRGLS